MSVVIIIAGSGGGHRAIDDANQAASQHSWTQAQLDGASKIITDFTKQLDTYRQSQQSP